MGIVSKSVWFESPGNATIREELLQQTGNKILLEALFSGVSLGTESLVLKGQVPREIQDQMRLKYQKGDFGFPIKYGYSLVGKVVSDSPLKDRLVHVLHPHQTHAMVEQEDIFVIDEEIPVERGALLSNLETAVNAIWDAKPLLGDRIAVVGFGLIGSMIARILKDIQGYDVMVNDISAKKKQLARQMGFKVVNTADGEFDLVFHCSGDYRGLQKSIKFAGKEAKVIELSWYGLKEGKLMLGTDFHYRRIHIISSQVSTIANKSRNYLERKRICLRLLKKDLFDDLITKIVPFQEVNKVYRNIDSIRQRELGIIIQY